jgi:hypothetical protein
MNNARLKSKGKLDLIHRDGNYCDLDVHIELVNKKWFKRSTGNFTAFARSRLQIFTHKKLNISVLSETDEWLYLAQHYCFHLFSNDKWLKDLYLIQATFSEAAVSELIATARTFHFERIVTAVCRRLKKKYPAHELKIPEMVTEKHRFFDTVSYQDMKFVSPFSTRIVALYWEFLFIHGCISRVSAYPHLLFPAPHILMDIYQCKTVIAFLLYPLHAIFVFVSSILFILELYGCFRPFARRGNNV